MCGTVIEANKFMNDFADISKGFHINFSVLKEKQDDCVGTGSLCVKEEFFRQETNVKLLLNETQQSIPLGIIVKLKILICT